MSESSNATGRVTTVAADGRQTNATALTATTASATAAGSTTTMTTSTIGTSGTLVVNCSTGDDVPTSMMAPTSLNAPTTTISTIAVQAGSARIVIALLKSKDELQLQILEMEPDLTRIGSNLDEALEYKRQHEDVLTKLQGKQSPVEELLNQADQLISTQKPKAEVYAAMAESLGHAWRDLNNQLEHRKQLLEQSVTFHLRAKELSDRLDKGEKACKDITLPSDAELLRKILQQHHDLKKGTLEASMYTLNESQVIVERLREVADRGTNDARPAHLRQSANSAISQVEQLVESLHDRRRSFEEIWTKHKQAIEECLQLSLLYGDIAQIKELLQRKNLEFSQQTNLGESSATAEIKQHECAKLQADAKQLQDRAIRLLRTAEQLTGAGHPAGAQAESKAYALLETCSEFAERVDNHLRLLELAVSFFRSAQSALTKLDQIDVQITTSGVTCGFDQLARTVEEVTAPPLQEGHELLDKAGRGSPGSPGSPGSQGVQRTVNELEERRRKLKDLLTVQTQESARKSEAAKTFLNTFNNLYMWIVNNGENFLQGHQDMGSVLAMAKEFLQRHENLYKDVQNKGPEIDAVFRSIPNLLQSAPDNVAEIDETMERLRSTWINVTTHLENRIQLSRLYFNFHRLAVQLANELDAFENVLFALRDGTQSTTDSEIEEKWLTIQQSSLQMKNTGKNFIADAKKNKDPYLDINRAVLCVKTLLEHFENRMTHLNHMRENYRVQTTQNKEMQMLWETNVSNIRKSMEWITTIEVDLYPVVSGNVMNVQSIISELERKLDTFVPNIKKAHAELEQQMKSFESLPVKGEPEAEKENLTSELTSVSSRLHARIMDYQILLNMFIAYFKKVLELERMVEKLNYQYVSTVKPTDVNSVEILLKEHDASRQAVLELFRFSTNERTPIVVKIRDLEPEVAAKQDEDKLRQVLDLIQQHWEKCWREHRQHLEQHLQLCQFNKDLNQINKQLQELANQLASVKGNFGDSLPAVKATSQAFVQLEKTIELLEQRIRVFTSTAQKMLSSNHANSELIRFEIQNLQNKWSTFHTQVSDNRKRLDLSIEYFKIVEEIEEFNKEGNKLLIQIARRSTSCRSPQEARKLLDEVQKFVASGKPQQEERLRKISKLSVQLYGSLHSTKNNDVSAKNTDMMDSFTVINNELLTLATNLQSNEVEQERYLKEKEVAEAALMAAKEEAASAKAAAAASDQARRAAEVAAKAVKPLHVFERIHVKEIQHVDREAVPIACVAADDGDEERNVQRPLSPPVVTDKMLRHVPPQFIVPLEDVKVAEGVKFRFECRVTGFPPPDVKWFKDGIAIMNNPDYKTDHDRESGMCSLSIEETFSADSAMFACKAGNASGVAETHGRLTVREHPVEELSPPVFAKPLEPAVAKVGDSFQFECHVTGKPMPDVVWLRNDVAIEELDAANCSITFADGHCCLSFQQLTVDDVATYTCRATNKAGVASSSANLIVQVAEQMESPVFLQPLSNVMARAGHKLRLQCVVNGVPIPEMTWSHDNKPLKDNRELKMYFDGRTATLVISEAFPKDAGSYVVVARNRAGESTSSCNVTVKGILPPETSDSELASDIELVKPRILLELKDSAFAENDTIRMDCIIVGQPEPEVIWYHNGKPVKESNDYQLLFEGDRCSLIIRQALPEDVGEYKVVAINSAGEAASRCELTIKDSKESEKTLNRLFSVDKATPPKFATLPVDTTMTEGEPFVLKCTVTGEPSPVITWYQDSRELKPSSNIQMSRDADGVLTLTIAKSSVEDMGTYTVKASNVAGDAKCFCDLTVVPPAAIVTKSAETRSARPPVFIKRFIDQVIQAGETVKFECTIEGHPQPKIQWYLDDKPVTEAADIQVTSIDNTHTLTMSAVTSEKNGSRTTCTAENDSGKATCTAVLKVSEPCEIIIPYDEEAEERQQTVQQSYRMTSVSKSTTMTQKSFTNKTTAVQSGGNVEFHQVATKEEHALQKINDVPVQEVHSSKKEEIHRTDPSLAPLVISQSTRALAETQNLSIENTAPQFSNVVQSTYNKPEAPKFVQPVTSVAVNAGDPVTLTGHIAGYPEPSVKWYKNSIEIFRSDFEASFVDGVATLKLPTTIAKDAGRYTCTARNIAGTASSSADVLVKSFQKAPQFVKSLQAQVVQKGQRVTLEVQVSGVPEPEITFYKNGNPIGRSGRCRVKTNGNKAALVIPEATHEDSGKYMVKATNPAGEAQSTSDIVVEEDTIVPIRGSHTVTSKHITTMFEAKKQTMMSSVESSSTTDVMAPLEQTEPKESRLMKTEAQAPQLQEEPPPSQPKYSPPTSKVWTQTKTPTPEKASIQHAPVLEDQNHYDVQHQSCLPEIGSEPLTQPPLKQKQPPPPPPKPKSITLSPKSDVTDDAWKPVADFRSSTPPTSSKIPIQPTYRPKSQSPLPSPSPSPSRASEPSPSWRPVATPWKPVSTSTPSESPNRPHITAYKKSTEYTEVQTTRTVTMQPFEPLLEAGPPPQFGYIDPKTYARHISPPPPPSNRNVDSKNIERPALVTPVYATEFPRASDKSIELKPGTPPEIGFIPKPSFRPFSPASQHSSSPVKTPVWVKSQSQTAPVFVKPLQDMHVEAGDPVVFECIVLGDPTPRIQWLRDGRSIPNGEQSMHQYNMCLLTIPTADPRDEGTITCVATNPAGSATTSAALKISDGCKRKKTETSLSTTDSSDSIQSIQPQVTSVTSHKKSSYVMSRISQFSAFK